MSPVIEKPEKRVSSSFRFKAHIHNNINHYANIYKRKKSSIVEEALEEYFEKEKKKEEEIMELRRLVQAGRESGFEKGIPTLDEIKLLAKKRHPHNHTA